MTLDRRRFLLGVAGAAAVGSRLPFALAAGNATFPNGVASGDPLADGVILWTRVPGGSNRSRRPVRWEVARDEAFVQIVAAGIAFAEASRDFTVHVDVGGLSPATTYWYRFVTGGEHSPVGRTHTARTGAVTAARFALVSCSNYAQGWYNPYARLALRDDLDAVLHVGDYIYETQGGGHLPRRHEPNRKCVSLDDYRLRYAQYRSDPDLQAAHAAHPWIVVWDDHEFANGAWSGGAGARAHEESDGPWEDRKAAAIQAWREWQPVRWPDSADPVRIWRSFSYGDLVDLVMIDTRMYGRERGDVDTGTFDPASDPPPTILGEMQKAWLLSALESSTARWRLIGNQVVMSPMRADPAEPPLPYLPPEIVAELGVRQGGGIQGNGNNWGAFQAERDELIQFLRERGIANNVVLSGDVHAAMAADVTEDPYTPYHLTAEATGAPGYEPATGLGSVAVELVCTSVSSNNAEGPFADLRQFGPTEPVEVVAYNTAFVAGNPHFRYADFRSHGYILIDLTPERMRAEYWDTGSGLVHAPDRPEVMKAAFEASHGPPGAPFTDHLMPA